MQCDAELVQQAFDLSAKQGSEAEQQDRFLDIAETSL
jgi:hypothetical protein